MTDEFAGRDGAMPPLRATVFNPHLRGNLLLNGNIADFARSERNLSDLA